MTMAGAEATATSTRAAAATAETASFIVRGNERRRCYRTNVVVVLR